MAKYIPVKPPGGGGDKYGRYETRVTRNTVPAWRPDNMQPEPKAPNSQGNKREDFLPGEPR